MAPLDRVGAPAVPMAPVAPTPPRAPHPRDLVLVDAAKKELNVSVVVVGSGAKSFGRALYATTGGPPAGATTEGTVDHFVVRLGEIRGWTTRLFVYALEASLETITTATELTRAASTVVLVQTSGSARIEPALYALANVADDARKGSASPRALAFIGPPEALTTLVNEAQITPDVVSHDGERAATMVTKEIMKRFLGAIRG
jgi:hypothetical protein